MILNTWKSLLVSLTMALSRGLFRTQSNSQKSSTVTVRVVPKYATGISVKLDESVLDKKLYFNPLTAKPIKWSSTLNQFVGNSWWIIWVYLTIVGLVLKGLRYWDSLFLVNWMWVFIYTILLKLLKQLEPLFILWSFFLRRFCFISLNLSCGLAWNTSVLAGFPNYFLGMFYKLNKWVFRVAFYRWTSKKSSLQV